MFRKANIHYAESALSIFLSEKMFPRKLILTFFKLRPTPLIKLQCIAKFDKSVNTKKNHTLLISRRVSKSVMTKCA